MNKKIILGTVISGLLVGGVITPLANIKTDLQNQIEENKKLEIKIKDLNIDLKNMSKQLKNMESIIQEKELMIEKLEKEKEELTKKLGRPQEFILTFYTTLPQENGGYTVTCEGKELKNGMVASNVYPLGTKIKINGKIFTVSDRGGKNFNHSNRLDVLVERNSGESDSEYLKRVNNLGKIKVTGYVLED